MDSLFPYDEPRKIQKALMEQIKSCVEMGQNVIAHAPTGLGKTAASLSPCLAHALKRNMTVLFLTPKHSQHHIAVETLKMIRERYKLDFQAADFIGKKHMCLQAGVDQLPNGEFHDYCRDLRKKEQCEFFLNIKNKILRDMTLREVTTPLHVEELVTLCRDNALCPYELAALVGKKSKVIVGDYYHILSPSIRKSLLERLGKNLSDCIIIFDEAHNLPDRCRDLLTISLNSLTVDRALKENKQFVFDYEDDLFNISNTLSSLAKKIPLEKNEVLVKKEEFSVDLSLVEPMKEAADIIREKQKKSSLGAVANFLEAWVGPDKSFTRICSRDFTKHGRPFISLSYNCLDPALLMKELEVAHSMIFMSGTLSPPSMYMDLLGLDFEKTIPVEYSSPFPQDNRLNLLVPVTTTKFTKRDEKMYKRISGMCSSISNAVPGNVALFFPSYDLRDQVHHFFKGESDKTLILEQPGLTKKERQEMIDTFKSYKKEGAVLLGAASGSFGEGIDLPGKLLNCVVIIGLPLGRPDLETQELIQYYDERFAKGWDYGYVYPAILKSLQNAGRCIRSETDKGCIVFLDERYLWESYKKCFPPDSCLEVTRLPVDRIKEFFKN